MKQFAPLSPELEHLAKITVDAAFKAHKVLGPGSLESVYEVCLAHELKQRGLAVETQVMVPILYEGVRLDAGFCSDLLVAGQLIVELKAVGK